MDAMDVDCIFSEPQFNPELVETVFGDSDVSTSEVIDPLGVDLELGPSLYPRLIDQLADTIARCAVNS
ncbi:hypothetical protein GCM10008094_33920 [Aidingimonas halophila]|nr:hypothetical protein GCM10008094_33920 [Aidingimonas halophila]